ncbi:MAG: HlyD family type I secretion periplasmic adaptor subunit [Alsobacter sp.]
MTDVALPLRPPQRQAVRHHLRSSLVLAVLFGGGLLVWSLGTRINGAVISPGTLVVDSSVRKVQHQTGGVVGEIAVRDGSHVEAGDVVIRLDDTIPRANLGIVSKSLDEVTARVARLEAERDERDKVVFPADLGRKVLDRDAERAMDGEQGLFTLRRTAREGQKAQLRERIAQLEQEIDGIVAQTEAKAKEVSLIRRELEGVKDLYRKNLIQLTRLTALQREEARLEGERGSLVAQAAQARGKVAETRLQILQIDQEFRSDVAKELRELQAKAAELGERRIAAQDQLDRVEVRAPLSGTVHQLAVHTVGGVVQPGEAMMLVVPDREGLAVEVKVPPQDIDHLHLGQDANLRFSAFNQRTTPEIHGRVSMIAADLTVDQRTGQSYYVARLSVEPQEIERLGQVKLIAGMPVEAFIMTGDRTVLSYLLKPVADQMTKTFRQP